MRTWYNPLTWGNKEVVQPPQQLSQELSENVANHLTALTKELETYKEHGTADPMLIAQAKVLAENLRSRGSVIDYQVAAAYGAVYTKVADTRKKLIRSVDQMRVFYLVDVLLNQFTDDALAPEVGTGNILEASSTREDIQKEIDFLEEKFDFDQLALSITPDLLAYGEYTLKTKVEPKPGIEASKKESVSEDLVTVVSPGDFRLKPLKVAPKQQTTDPLPKTPTAADQYGLIDLMDTVEQGTVVSLTQYSETLGYLSQEQDRGKVNKHEPADYVKFSLSSQRVRIDLHKEFSYGVSAGVPDALKDVPRYIRVGKSLIYPIISKIKELELLEALVPATKLSKLASGTIVGVQVPTGYDIQKAMEAAKQVEQLLNKRMGVDPKLGELTIENIMNTTGRYKVVPIFGEKGQLSRMDYQSDEPDELLASVKEIREVICSSVGLPYELIFGSDSDGKKGELLKKYARYLRKLKAIQKSIEEGIRQIIYIHLVNKGFKFTNEDIKVEFFNKLIEIDNLDKLEFIDTTIGLLDNAKKFVMELSDPAQNPKFADKVDTEEFLDFLNAQLNVIGFNNLIMVKKDDVVGTHTVRKNIAREPGDQHLKALPNKPPVASFNDLS